MARQLVRQSEYARMRGVSEAAVSKAVKRGAIILLGDRIDVEVADVQWFNGSRAAAERDGRQALSASSADVPGAQPPNSAEDTIYRQLKEEQLRRERSEADIADMKARQMAGDLLERGPTAKAIADASALIGASMDRLADRIAPRVAVESDEHACHALISAETDALRSDLAATISRLAAGVGLEQRA